MSIDLLNWKAYDLVFENCEKPTMPAACLYTIIWWKWSSYVRFL